MKKFILKGNLILKLPAILYFQLCVNVIGLHVDFKIYEVTQIREKSKYHN